MARIEARKAGAQARMAAKDSARAMRDLALAVRDGIADAQLDERAAEVAERLQAKAVELAERAQDSEMMARAAEQAEQLAERVRASETVARVSAHGHEAAQRVRDADATARVQEHAGRMGEQGMQRLGTWLADGPAGQRLGLQRRGSGMPTWLALGAGLAAGLAVGYLMGTRNGEHWEGPPEAVAPPLGRGQIDLRAPTELEERVRDRLRGDARTADLDRVDVNIAERTVFVRGEVPAGYDERTLVEVVRTVDGVDDVDVQVTVRA